MGSIGSGRGTRRNAWRSKKLYTTSLPCVDVPKMVNDSKTPGIYFTLKNIKLTVKEDIIHLEPTDGTKLQQTTLGIASIPCHYGGSRYFGLCPYCQKRVRNLYLLQNLFACRNCLKMVYPSQNETLHVRLLQQEDKAKTKLNNDEWTKPKWMRQKTFERFRGECFDLERMADLANFLSLRSKKTVRQAMEMYGGAECVPFEVAMTQYGKYWNPNANFEDPWETLATRSKGRYTKETLKGLW